MFNPLNLIIVKAVLMLITAERIFNKKNKFLSQNILYLINFMIRFKKIILP